MYSIPNKLEPSKKSWKKISYRLYSIVYTVSQNDSFYNKKKKTDPVNKLANNSVIRYCRSKLLILSILSILFYNVWRALSRFLSLRLHHHFQPTVYRLDLFLFIARVRKRSLRFLISYYFYFCMKYYFSIFSPKLKSSRIRPKSWLG